jgi:hypothetical protein
MEMMVYILQTDSELVLVAEEIVLDACSFSAAVVHFGKYDGISANVSLC